MPAQSRPRRRGLCCFQPAPLSHPCGTARAAQYAFAGRERLCHQAPPKSQVQAEPEPEPARECQRHRLRQSPPLQRSARSASRRGRCRYGQAPWNDEVAGQREDAERGIDHADCRRISFVESTKPLADKREAAGRAAKTGSHGDQTSQSAWREERTRRLASIGVRPVRG